MVRSFAKRVLRRVWRKLRPPADRSAAAPAAPAPAEDVEIEGDRLKAWLGDPNVLLLDVREPNELLAGHAEGAWLLPMNQVADRLDELPKDRKIVVYCAVGSRSYGVAPHASTSPTCAGFASAATSGGSPTARAAGFRGTSPECCPRASER